MIFLYLEDRLLLTSSLCVNDIRIAPHESADIIYATTKLSDAKYIETSQISYSHDTVPTIHVHSLTWDGHKLLDNIRDDNVWEKTNSVVAQFSSVSIGIIEEISNRIILEMIDEHFQLIWQK